MRLVYFSGAWVLGIFLASKATTLLTILLPMLLTLLMASLGFLLWDRKRRLTLLLCLLLFVGGFLRFQESLPEVDEHHLQFYNGVGTVMVEGVVTRDPEIGERTVSLELSARSIREGETWKKVEGGLLVRAPHLAQEYHYGDRLLVTGKLQAPPERDDFDYPSYLARKGIYSVMFYPRINILEREQGSWFERGLSSLRNRLSHSLNVALPEPQASLAQALLLGIRRHLPDSLREDFYSTGTAHLLAISGLHLSLLMGFVLGLGAGLWGRQRPTYIIVALGVIWLYALLAGARPPTLRAAIMGSFFLGARGLGRPYSPLALLAFAAALMSGVNPLLLWDISFQLSFAAMMGLLFLAPSFQRLARTSLAPVMGEGRWTAGAANLIASNFAVSLGAILATLPLLVYSFHRLSLVGLPATLLTVPALSGGIIAAFIGGILGLFTPLLSQVAGWAAWLFFSYIIKVITVFASFPFASLDVGAVGVTVVWAYYALLAAALWFIPLWRRGEMPLVHRTAVLARAAGNKLLGLTQRLPRRATLGFLFLSAAITWAAALTPVKSSFEVSFLDVGQGDAALIVTPSGRQILIDGGPSPEVLLNHLGSELPFWDRSIDLVVLTHPHDDHLAGLVEVMRRYQIERVLEPGMEHDSPAYQSWLRLIREKKVKYTRAVAGQRIELERGAALEVLHPQEEILAAASDLDNNGVVLRLVVGKVSFLFTGDIGEEAEQELLYQGKPVKSTVLKVAHHGSSSSTSPSFLAAVDPQVAVLSVGADSRSGHPHEEVLVGLRRKVGEENIFLTAEHGSITFATDGEKLWVNTEK